MERIKLLQSVDMFNGLTDDQLTRLADIFELRTLDEGEVLFHQGDEGGSLCLIEAGFVVVSVESGAGPEGRTLVNLGPGQSVGEMALIDRGPRSATVRATVPGTRVAIITREAFERLCDEDTSIGYRVMRNIAADLSFRLRHRELGKD